MQQSEWSPSINAHCLLLAQVGLLMKMNCALIEGDRCHLVNRPRIILQNVISSVSPFILQTLLHGVDEFDFTENKKIINETLKFIHETKRFE